MCGTAFGHIGETRMEKFHYDGFLKSFDYESSDTCNFSPKSEVTEIPFTGHKERAANLLVIIHLMCVVR